VLLASIIILLTEQDSQLLYDVRVMAFSGSKLSVSIANLPVQC